MGFRHPDRFLWDFWTIEHEGLTWLYALSAPRDPDPHTRHDRARIDVLTSADLRDWTWRGVALDVGPPGAWDDMALWTGSVVADRAGGFAMLYTGRRAAEGGRVQRIGLARSTDLLTWAKHPGPVMEADPARYRLSGRNGSTNWRDPWVEWDEEEGLWRAWITAQRPDGRVDDAGTIAHATSPDLVTWRVDGPVVAERLTEHLEVPQLVRDGRGMLLNVYGHHVPEGGSLPRMCMSLLYERNGDGYRFDRIVEAWPTDRRYIVKEVRPGTGLCFLGFDAEGTFRGELSDPFDLAL
jgi:beta-fructofuranosidase